MGSPNEYNNGNANVHNVNNDGNLNNNNVNNTNGVRGVPTKISKVLMHRLYSDEEVTSNSNLINRLVIVDYLGLLCPKENIDVMSHINFTL